MARVDRSGIADIAVYRSTAGYHAARTYGNQIGLERPSPEFDCATAPNIQVGSRDEAPVVDHKVASSAGRIVGATDIQIAVAVERRIPALR